MCTVTINIDEAQVRKAYPNLTSKEAITRWAQQLVDTRIADLAEEYPLPEGLKPYTIEELHARIAEAEREIAAGGGIPHEEVMRRSREKLARKKKELEMADAI